MSKNILLVFEGESTEDKIFANLGKYYLNENTIITCAYCSTIYQLYKVIKNDEDLDTFTLLKERNQNKEKLKDYESSNFAEIYMFFDYDGHDPIADDDKLKELLSFFNEETDKGKLFISYPMIESLKHFPKTGSFKSLLVECKKNINYKKKVNKDCIKTVIDFNKFKLKTWKWIITEQLKKANFITSNKYSEPTEIIDQEKLINSQLEKYIIPHEKVSVVNSIPLFLLEYYGVEKLWSFVK